MKKLIAILALLSLGISAGAALISLSEIPNHSSWPYGRDAHLDTWRTTLNAAVSGDATKSITIALTPTTGLDSTAGTFYYNIFAAPAALTVESAYIVSTTASGTDGAANSHLITLENLTQANSLCSAGLDTEGAGIIAADTATSLGVNQNATIAANDVLAVKIVTDGTTAVDLSAVSVSVTIHYN